MTLVVLAGVRKSGTTALWHQLKAHPEICPASVKEPQYFCLQNYNESGPRRWYQDLFGDGDHTYRLDASTMCFTAKGAACRISQVDPQARVIVLLREPVARTYSSYLHMAKQIPQAETRSFQKVLDSLEAREGTLWEKENSSLIEAAAQDKVDIGYYDRSFHSRRFGVDFWSIFENPVSPFRYFGESMYAKYLQHYRRRFTDRLKVIVSERFWRRPGEVLSEVGEWLSLDPTGFELSRRKSNKTVVPRNQFSRIVLALRQHRAEGGIFDVIVSLMKKAGVASYIREEVLSRPKPEVRNQDRIRAENLLAASCFEKVEELVPVELHYWWGEKARGGGA